jgi:hypothetical protein
MKQKIYRVVLKDKPKRVYAKTSTYAHDTAEELRKSVVKLGYKKAYIVLEDENRY